MRDAMLDDGHLPPAGQGLPGLLALPQRQIAVDAAPAGAGVTAAARAEAPAASPTVATGRGMRSRGVAALGTGAALALGWAGLTGGAPGSWAIGLPAVLAGAALAWWAGPAPAWRLSPLGALRFGGWFAVQSVLGAWDVARRAFNPRLPVAPGYRRHPLTLPAGAPRLVMANAITLLPGTLTAELHDDHLIVHMLDTGQDLAADLAALEARVRDLFALRPEADR
jgi:multicomponent Na+:H+ antiporter subunit E